jgi:hypothetical protein
MKKKIYMQQGGERPKDCERSKKDNGVSQTWRKRTNQSGGGEYGFRINLAQTPPPLKLKSLQSTCIPSIYCVCSFVHLPIQPILIENQPSASDPYIVLLSLYQIWSSYLRRVVKYPRYNPPIPSWCKLVRTISTNIRSFTMTIYRANW